MGRGEPNDWRSDGEHHNPRLEAFPYGYFRAWTLDANAGRFERI